MLRTVVSLVKRREETPGPEDDDGRYIDEMFESLSEAQSLSEPRDDL